MFNLKQLLFAMGVVALALGTPLHAGYTLTNIVDDATFTEGFSPDFTSASINDAGDVAFSVAFGEIVSGKWRYGIYVDSGSGPVTYFDNTNPVSNLGQVLSATINNSGQVGFYGLTDEGVNSKDGIYRLESPGNVTTIAFEGGTYDGLSSSIDMNDSGQVVFYGYLASSSNSGLFVGNGGSGHTAIAIDDNSTYYGVSTEAKINNSGVVAFNGATENSIYASGTFTGNGVTTNTVLQGNTTDQEYRNFGGASINTSGDVAYWLEMNDTFRDHYIFVNQDLLNPVASTESYIVYSYLFNPLISDNGTVAFEAESGIDDLYGIYVGDDPLTDKVISVGDSLFGSIVSSVFLEDINAAGTILFRYTLEDGRSGIAIAGVPEPTAIVMLTLLGLPLAFRRSAARLSLR